MALGLTPKQRELLTFISDTIATTGSPPTFASMATHLDVRSKSTISRLVRGLEDRGFIRRGEHRARSISLLAKPNTSCPHCGHLIFSTACLEAALAELAKPSPRIRTGQPGAAA